MCFPVVMTKYIGDRGVVDWGGGVAKVSHV
jgi:hypothetical protein